MKTYMVFDVESVGLHGEGFAVGFVVVDDLGSEIQHGLIACHPAMANGNAASRDWVRENIPALTSVGQYQDPKEVRDAFWRQWMDWKAQGALLFADCAWPVEAKFLLQCVMDDSDVREWQGPYPLHDIATALLAHGKDPLQKFPRLPSELPEHNPLADARQSARILIETLYPKG